ncbi:MAG: tRNA-(ms[2]io[6]A)-hydroxylase [Pseudomonadales bacterium]
MSTRQDNAVQRVLKFLPCRTPQAWLDQVPAHLPELLIDHANCEKKAAGSALSLLYRYVEHPELMSALSKLAREELRHFEQVCEHLAARKIPYRHLSSSRYVASLRSHIRTHEPWRLIDTLLVCAVVEARSCERFLSLAGVLPEDLAAFYRKLLASEARHFTGYLHQAERLAGESCAEKLAQLLTAERDLILSPDTDFRFHSGPLRAV